MHKKTNTVATIVILLVAAVLASAVLGAPMGPGISYISTSQKNNAENGTIVDNSSQGGGTINVMNMRLNEQNVHWKAYVGNITGSLTLDDSDNYTIYDWTSANLQGEVYATRATSVTWSNVTCADATDVDIEMKQLNHTPIFTPKDNVSNTMDGDANNHAGFYAGVVDITANSCAYTVNLYENETDPGAGSAVWEEVLLFTEKANRSIYVSLIDENAWGYNNESKYDYQILLPEKGEPGWTSATAYYFYVELL